MKGEGATFTSLSHMHSKRSDLLRMSETLGRMPGLVRIWKPLRMPKRKLPSAWCFYRASPRMRSVSSCARRPLMSEVFVDFDEEAPRCSRSSA